MTTRSSTLIPRTIQPYVFDMSVDPRVQSQDVTGFEDQYLWHDTEMHSDRDVLDLSLVKAAALEPTD